MADALSSRRLVSTVAALSSTTMEKPKSSNRLSCGSGVAVSVGVGVVCIIAKVGVGAGILVDIGEGIMVAVGGGMVGMSVGEGVTSGVFFPPGSAAICCGVLVGEVGTSGSFEQAAVPVTITDRISAISSRDGVLFPALKDRRFI